MRTLLPRVPEGADHSLPDAEVDSRFPAVVLSLVLTNKNIESVAGGVEEWGLASRRGSDTRAVRCGPGGPPMGISAALVTTLDAPISLPWAFRPEKRESPPAV